VIEVVVYGAANRENSLYYIKEAYILIQRCAWEAAPSFLFGAQEIYWRAHSLMNLGSNLKVILWGL